MIVIFLKINKKKVEVPQTFWMRIAMGLRCNENDKNKKQLNFMNFFHHYVIFLQHQPFFIQDMLFAQLSSCYLTTVQ